MSTQLYLAQSGDTLQSIMSRFDMTLGNLLSLNPELSSSTGSIPSGLILSLAPGPGSSTYSTSSFTSTATSAFAGEIGARLLILIASLSTGLVLTIFERKKIKKSRSQTIKRIRRRFLPD